MGKTYKVSYTLQFSPDEHFGVPRNECKCGVCPDGSIVKEGTEEYIHGEEYEVDGETFVMEDLFSAESYLDAKYESDNFDVYEYFEESKINPNDNNDAEFSDGFGDEQFDIDKVELYNDETNELLETTDKDD